VSLCHHVGETAEAVTVRADQSIYKPVDAAPLTCGHGPEEQHFGTSGRYEPPLKGCLPGEGIQAERIPGQDTVSLIGNSV